MWPAVVAADDLSAVTLVIAWPVILGIIALLGSLLVHRIRHT